MNHLKPSMMNELYEAVMDIYLYLAIFHGKCSNESFKIKLKRILDTLDEIEFNEIASTKKCSED